MFKPKKWILNRPVKLYLGNNVIKIVTEIKSLGVFFREHLTWTPRILCVSTKLNRLNAIMYKQIHLLPIRARRFICNALFLPNLTHSHSILGTTKKSIKHKLLVPQKKSYKEKS